MITNQVAWRRIATERALLEGMVGDPAAQTVKYSREMTLDAAKELIEALALAESALTITPQIAQDNQSFWQKWSN